MCIVSVLFFSKISVKQAIWKRQFEVSSVTYISYRQFIRNQKRIIFENRSYFTNFCSFSADRNNISSKVDFGCWNFLCSAVKAVIALVHARKFP